MAADIAQIIWHLGPHYPSRPKNPPPKYPYPPETRSMPIRATHSMKGSKHNSYHERDDAVNVHQQQLQLLGRALHWGRGRRHGFCLAWAEFLGGLPARRPPGGSSPLSGCLYRDVIWGAESLHPIQIQCNIAEIYGGLAP